MGEPKVGLIIPRIAVPSTPYSLGWENRGGIRYGRRFSETVERITVGIQIESTPITTDSTETPVAKGGWPRRALGLCLDGNRAAMMDSRSKGGQYLGMLAPKPDLDDLSRLGHVDVMGQDGAPGRTGSEVIGSDGSRHKVWLQKE